MGVSYSELFQFCTFLIVFATFIINVTKKK